MGSRLRLSAPGPRAVWHTAAARSPADRRPELLRELSDHRRLARARVQLPGVGPVPRRSVDRPSCGSGFPAAGRGGQRPVSIAPLPIYRHRPHVRPRVGGLGAVHDDPAERVAFAATHVRGHVMREWLTDLAVGLGLAVLAVFLLLCSSFNSTFIYRGF